MNQHRSCICTGLLSVLLVLGFGACDLVGLGDEPAQLFEIHLQGHFDDNLVRVEVDGKTVYEGVTRTDQLIGLAERIPLETTNGLHRIRVSVDSDITYHQRVLVQDTLYVGVTYDPKGARELAFRLSTTGFFYF